MNRFERGLNDDGAQEQFANIGADNSKAGSILVRYSKAQRHALKRLALDEEKPMETLMHEALVLLLKHYGRDVPWSPRVDEM